MALYVDDARNRYGRMLMSHMMADTPEELEAARLALGIPPTAIHHPGSPDEHMDLSQAKRQQAIGSLSAVPVTQRFLVRMRQQRRRTEAAGPEEA